MNPIARSRGTNPAVRTAIAREARPPWERHRSIDRVRILARKRFVANPHSNNSQFQIAGFAQRFELASTARSALAGLARGESTGWSNTRAHVGAVEQMKHAVADRFE